MSQKVKTEEQLEKERIIKFAASFGVKLTVSDKPSDQRYVPEKYRNFDEVVSKMDWTHIER
jgi:ClpP class serine protease